MFNPCTPDASGRRCDTHMGLPLFPNGCCVDGLSTDRAREKNREGVPIRRCSFCGEPISVMENPDGTEMILGAREERQVVSEGYDILPPTTQTNVAERKRPGATRYTHNVCGSLLLRITVEPKA